MRYLSFDAPGGRGERAETTQALASCESPNPDPRPNRNRNRNPNPNPDAMTDTMLSLTQRLSLRLIRALTPSTSGKILECLSQPIHRPFFFTANAASCTESGRVPSMVCGRFW